MDAGGSQDVALPVASPAAFRGDADDGKIRSAAA